MNDNDPLAIPVDWTDEQALAIFDFVDKFREIVVREYQEAIMHQFGIKMGEPELYRENSEPFDFDDEIDF